MDMYLPRVQMHAFLPQLAFRQHKGWVDPTATSVKQDEKFLALKNEAQLKKTHYLLAMGNGRQLKQATGLLILWAEARVLILFNHDFRKTVWRSLYCKAPDRSGYPGLKDWQDVD